MKRHFCLVACIATALLITSGCAKMGAAPAPEMSYEEPAPPVEEAAQAPGLGRGADAEAAQSATTMERMVIRTADLDLVVPDTETALQEIQDLAKELEGYVVSLNTYQYEGGMQGEVIFRVPAESLDTALQRLRGLASTVRRESISGQDVTAEYVDLESRLNHLRAKEEQLLEFLDQAEDTEATLAVYEQLAATQQEIEQVQGRMQYLENQAALSTITVSLIPDALAQPLETGGWNLPSTVRSAVEALLDVVEFFVKALIIIAIVGLPTLVIVAIPVAGLVLFIRWIIRRRRRKSAE